MVSTPRKCWFSIRVIAGIALLLFCLWLSGCVFDTSGIPPIRDWYDCSAELWHCQRQADAKPDIGLIKLPWSSADLNRSANAISYPVMAKKDQTYPLYHDKNVVIYSINDDELKGSLLIPTGFGEWGNSDEEYFGILFNNDIEALYIAYDSRTFDRRSQKKERKIPAWLARDYEPYFTGEGRIPTITTSLLDPSKPQGTGYPPFLTLDVYRHKRPLKSGDKIFIPGNSFDSIGLNNKKIVKDWGEIKAGDPLMYVVLVKPKINWDCSAGHKIDTVGFEGCFDRASDAQQLAEFAATQSWNQNFPFAAKKGIQCGTRVQCGDANKLVGGALTVQPRAYVYSSEIQFGSPSSAKVTIDGNTYIQSVQGKLHFEYLLKTHDLRLNSMYLSVDPFSTSHGSFSDIEIYLLETIMANCKGLTIPDAPCDQYELKPATVFCAENFKRNGKPHLFVSENSTLMPIAIDHQNRTFTIKGSLASSVKVNGDTLPIKVDLDLVGKFVNLAPVPNGDESDTFSQCVEGTNMNPIQLNAAGSYDVYEPLPTSKATYNWIEDYGMLTEKLWGQGKAVTIGKGQVAFGVHDITLSVEDAHGVAANTTLHVQVADTLPPSLKIPADVYMLFLEDPGQVKVDIGMGYAKDMCSSEVMVTNNAPQDLRFPAGQVTEVTWRAEDLRGNAVTGTQRVHVMVLKPFRPQFERAISSIRESLKHTQFQVTACDDGSQCFVDVKPLIRGVEQLVYLSSEAKLPISERSELRRKAMNAERARSLLDQAQKRLDRSNQSGSQRTLLRESARDDIRKALEMISKAME